MTFFVVSARFYMKSLQIQTYKDSTHGRQMSLLWTRWVGLAENTRAACTQDTGSTLGVQQGPFVVTESPNISLSKS